MKNTKSKMALLVAAALMGLNQPAQAGEQRQSTGKFIPLEQLSPNERHRVEQIIRTLEGIVRIDWSSVIIGVDENGNLVLRARTSVDLAPAGEPSCWSGGGM